MLDQDEALDFYTTHLGFEARDDIDLGFMRWLTVGVPGQDTSILLELVGVPNTTRPRRSRCANWSPREPVQQPYGTDFGIRDPFGNHIRISQPTTASPTDVQQAYEGAGR